MNTHAVAQAGATETLPEPVARRDISEAQWRTLCNSLFPGANPQSVLMVVDYCRARKLDPLKKPCHIVPMQVKDARTGKYVWRDVVMPGIYEYRTSAQRTGEYLGHSAPEYGETVDLYGVTAPEWCALTVWRWNSHAKQSVPFPVCVQFREVCATKDGHANSRWSRAPVQMLTKCAEAAALREAFPDEFGGEPTFEEMIDQEPNIASIAAEQRQGHVVASPRPYPPELFDSKLAAWGALIESGGKNADDLIAMIETKGQLTDEQKQTLRAIKPDTETTTEEIG